MNAQTNPKPDLNWAEILPWTIIFRSLAPACSVTVMALAMIGVVATPMGWIVAESLFIGSEDYLNSNPIVAEIAEINRSPYRGVFLASEDSDNKFMVLGARLSGPRLVFEQMVKPFYAVFGGATTAREFLYFVCGSLWSILVWSFVGLGIARVCLLKLARNESAGLDDAFEFAIGKFGTCFAAVSMPIGLAFLLCIPTFFVGLLLGFDFGALLIGIFWFVVLGIAFLMGILLLGMMVGWPLVVSSVAAEGQNAFDAVTRAYAYLFQRPVNYFFYAIIAILFGGVCWLIVHEFTGSVIRLGFWSTSWGANRVSADRIDVIKGELPSSERLDNFAGITPRSQDSRSRDPVQPVDSVFSDPANPAATPSPAGLDEPQSNGIPPDPAEINADNEVAESTSLVTARRFIQFWTDFAKTVAAAFIHGLFWCMAAAIYLLLRKDVDETEMDEIFMIDERRTYDLPPLESDKYGIPQVQPLPADEKDVPDGE